MVCTTAIEENEGSKACKIVCIHMIMLGIEHIYMILLFFLCSFLSVSFPDAKESLKEIYNSEHQV